MTVNWIVEDDDPKRLKEFLKNKGVSRRIIGRVKFHGGSFVVNDEEVRVRKALVRGDEVKLNLPIEPPNPNLTETYIPLEIIFEDEHYLLLNKPVDLISVPSSAHTGDTVASRVKAYYLEKDYRHKVVHVVTRLDRYTSGTMLIAKHTLAHSMMGALLEEQTLIKHYEAVVHGHVAKKHGFIEAPIARSPHSIIERQVGADGKPALTEYQVLAHLAHEMTHVKLSLHTGRTHQIRVHMAHLGHPLVGDDLYGGSKDLIGRQALHCRSNSFVHPFTGESLTIKAPLPADMQQLIERNN